LSTLTRCLSTTSAILRGGITGRMKLPASISIVILFGVLCFVLGTRLQKQRDAVDSIPDASTVEPESFPDSLWCTRVTDAGAYDWRLSKHGCDVANVPPSVDGGLNPACSVLGLPMAVWAARCTLWNFGQYDLPDGAVVRPHAP
jgi:hypothetical protein